LQTGKSNDGGGKKEGSPYSRRSYLLRGKKAGGVQKRPIGLKGYWEFNTELLGDEKKGEVSSD